MAFTPKTPKIQQLAEMNPDRIQELDLIFGDKTNIYVDWANVVGWQPKLWRHIDPRRLYQFLRSFSAIDKIRWYFGTLVWDNDSEKNIAKVRSYGYLVTTKPVKIMHHSVDVSSLAQDDAPDILKSFLTKWLLHHLPTESIRILNQELEKINQQGTFKIEEKKCNFDVEIGVDMILDDERSPIKDYYKTYILWSGDSDFTDIVQKLILQGKRVFIFATTQRVSKELAESGAYIFDIQKIREFICWTREMQMPTQTELFDIKQKGISEETP